MSVRVLPIAFSAVLITAVSLTAIPTASSAQKKAVPPKAGAACAKSGQTAAGLVCALDGGKLKWQAAPTSTVASPTTALAPKEEGGDKKLVVACGAQEDWCQALTKAFEKKTGIKTSFVRLSSGETVARLGAAKSNPEFDVWHGGPSDGFEVAGRNGLIEPYVSPNAAVIPASYKSSTGMWTGVYIGVLGFCSNASTLRKINASIPRSWNEILSPKFKGQFAMSHPSTSGTAYTALWTMTQVYGSEDAAIDYFKALNPNVFQYTKSGITPGQMAGRGEIATGLIFSHDCLKFREEGLSDLVVSFPGEGTGYEIGGLGMIKGAKNQSAAKQYIDWALTSEAQEIPPTVRSYQIPTNPNAKVSDRAVKLSDVKLVNYDDQKAGAAKSALTKRFDAEVANAPR